MRISDWSSDVCSSDLGERPFSLKDADHERLLNMIVALTAEISVLQDQQDMLTRILVARGVATDEEIAYFQPDTAASAARATKRRELIERVMRIIIADAERSEEHTSALQSLMRISYAVFCLKKKTQHTNT